MILSLITELGTYIMNGYFKQIHLFFWDSTDLRSLFKFSY